MSHFSFLQEQDGMTEVVGYNPERLGHFGMMIENLFRGPSELSVAERELIVTYCSGLNACSFCTGSHRAMAEAYGADPDLLKALLETDDFAMVEVKLRPILALAKKLTQAPATVYKGDIDKIIEAGWSERAAHDAICCIATINFGNRLIDGHGVKGSPEYFDRDGERLGPKGPGYKAALSQ